MLKQGVILAAGQGGTISSTDLGIFSWDLFNFWSVINNILKYLTLFSTSFIRFRHRDTGEQSPCSVFSDKIFLLILILLELNVRTLRLHLH